MQDEITPTPRSRSLVRTLADRGVRGRSPYEGVELNRRRWSIAQVLAPEDSAVLLGFSSDGQYLIYYSLWELSHSIRWKRIVSPIMQDQITLEAFLQLNLGEQSSHSRDTYAMLHVHSRLRIWQSPDDDLIVGIVSETQVTSQDKSCSYHVAISPTPSLIYRRNALVSRSVSFSYTISSPHQDLEPWQLMSLGNHNYSMVLNMGSSVTFLTWAITEVSTTTSGLEAEVPKILFGTSEWYAPSEYPFELHINTYTRSQGTGSLDISLVSQYEFDCEAFLSTFLQKYVTFRHLHLVDYDFQLVRVSQLEKSVYMSCVADMKSTPGVVRKTVEHSRLVLLLCLEMMSGDCHVIRALKVPNSQSLRRVSLFFIRNFASDLARRILPEPLVVELTNDPVTRDESLSVLNNPRYPVSIHR